MTEQINCFGLGTVKVTSVMHGVRDGGLVFTRGILVYEECTVGPRTGITDPANERGEPQHSS